MRFKQVVFGQACHIPGIYGWLSKNAGGGESARYCYSVWLRHLVLVDECRAGGVPDVVAELGPGDSLGAGLAALLSGAGRYVALDVVPHGELERNLGLLDELVELFESRADIPGPDEFPDVKPRLDSWTFPSRILTDDVLARSLAPQRVRRIRDSILDPDAEHSIIRYAVPWTARASLEKSSVDMVFSQAVLEHVDDLEGVYPAMAAWLRSGGVMSHEIDMTAHQLDSRWNVHWTWPEWKWRLVKGGRPYLINRAALSVHLELIERSGFDLRFKRTVERDSAIRRGQLARRFQNLDDNDLTTSAAYVVATR